MISSVHAHTSVSLSQLPNSNEAKIDFFPVIKLLIDAFNVLITGSGSVLLMVVEFSWLKAVPAACGHFICCG
jgi:hypothetical protein